jgi:hypothetical protein
MHGRQACYSVLRALAPYKCALRDAIFPGLSPPRTVAVWGAPLDGMRISGNGKLTFPLTSTSFDGVCWPSHDRSLCDDSWPPSNRPTSSRTRGSLRALQRLLLRITTDRPSWTGVLSRSRFYRSDDAGISVGRGLGSTTPVALTTMAELGP